MALISKILPDSIDKALQDQSWIDTMQEQLNQFEKSKVWTPVPLPKDNLSLEPMGVQKQA